MWKLSGCVLLHVLNVSSVPDCLFKVCPMSRYSAQKQYWKAKQAKHEKDKISDVVLLQKLQVKHCLLQEPFEFLHSSSCPELHVPQRLQHIMKIFQMFPDRLVHRQMLKLTFTFFQHASNLEQKQNETENKKVHGDVVKYGTVLQVTEESPASLQHPPGFFLFVCLERLKNVSGACPECFINVFRTSPGVST